MFLQFSMKKNYITKPRKAVNYSMAMSWDFLHKFPAQKNKIFMQRATSQETAEILLP